MRRRSHIPRGTVYRRRARAGHLLPTWWLSYRFPGDTAPRREPTNPPTHDEAEARRQLHERLGERGHLRAQRLRADTVTVDDLLDLYLLDCADQQRPVQQGRVEPWRTALGAVLACEVRRPDLDALCRRWQRRGLTWDAGTRTLADGSAVMWTARDPQRVRPVSGANCNRLIAVLRRAYTLGKEKVDLTTPLTFPHYAERRRGEYLTEDQCRGICAQFQAKAGAEVKADVFRFAYLTGIRKGQLTRTRKRHVLIAGETWKLRWPGEETKNGEPHELMLVGEELEIVQRAWAKRLPDCDFLFHVNGKRLGPMISELRRTCAALGIPYGRRTGVVFHDTRHSAVTNLVASGTGEAAAMSITGHADPTIFKRYNLRRDSVQAEAAERRTAYLAAQRGTTPSVPSIATPK
jgi:integrase